jgi:hypothetical protein
VTEHSVNREDVTDQRTEDRPEAGEAMDDDEKIPFNKTTDAREQPQRRRTPEETVSRTNKCATMDREKGK